MIWRVDVVGFAPGVAYPARDNQELIVKARAEPFIPFKSTSKPHPQTPRWNRLYHVFALNRSEFEASAVGVQAGTP